MKIWMTAWAIGTALLAVPAAAAGITYDCDTAANHFSELSLPAGTGPFTVSGNVRLNALAASEEYVAITRVTIASPVDPGKSLKEFAGFSLSALPVDPKKVRSGAPAVQMLHWMVNGKKDELVPLSFMMKPGAVQPFSLSYDGSKVVVSVAVETRSFAVKVADPVVNIVCSTGEFLFTDMVIKPGA